MKKFFALFLTILLLLSSVAFAEFDGLEASESPIDFTSAALAIVEENWHDNYFSAITLTIDDDMMLIDDKEVQMSATAEIINGELVLPIIDIAEAIGSDVILEHNGDVVIIDDDTETLLAVSQTVIMSNEETVHMMSSEDIEEALNVEVLNIDNEIIIIKPYQTKQLLVQTVDGRKLTDTYGAIQAIDDGNGFHVLLYASEIETQEAECLLNVNPKVKYAEPNRIISMHGIDNETATATTTNDSSPLPNRWGSERINADSFKKYLSQNGKTEEIIVAVIDSGVDVNHPFLKDRIYDNPNSYRLNFYDNNPSSLFDVTDYLAHGTHVAGTIVDCTPENVKILPIRVNLYFNDLYYNSAQLNIILAIRSSAEYGAKVLNMSFGYGDVYGTGAQQAYEDAIDYAAALGTTSVIAAGNSTLDIGGAWHMNNLTGDYYFAPTYPANCANGITVAATDATNSPTWFSNFGNEVDLAAPGYQIWSSVPSNYTGGDWILGNDGGKYALYDGTSMATPHVAGAIAMLKLDIPNASPELLKRIVCQAINIPSNWNNNNRNYGTGILNLDNYTKPEIISTASNLAYNGAFTLGQVKLSAKGAFLGYYNNVYIVVNKCNDSGIITSVSGDVGVNLNTGIGTYNPNVAVNTFASNEYIEIKIYENSSRQKLLSQQFIYPAAFTFS